jgi:hypothetical protein
MWHRHTPCSVFLSRFGRSAAAQLSKAEDLLFLGPGREGSTPRHESDVASRLFGFLGNLLMHHRAFGPMNDGRRSRPGQHRLPPRSSGHDPCSRRGKRRDYQSGLQGGDKIMRRKMRKSYKILKKRRKKIQKVLPVKKLSRICGPVLSLRRACPPFKRQASITWQPVRAHICRSRC